MYSWISLASGAGHTLAVRTDNTLWAWGANNYGQLGDSTTINRSSPTQIAANTTWAKVFAGSSYTAAITTLGALYMWGTNATGELGLGDTVNKSSPTQLGANSWTTIALGKSTNAFTLGIRSNGSLWSWGNNATYSALGDGTTVNKSSPIQLGTSSWSQVAAGISHAAAIDIIGRLFTWGSNAQGELGLQDLNGRNSPVQASAGLSFSMVSAGGIFSVNPFGTTAAIRNDGLLFTTGYNSTGSLGTNDTSNRSAFTYVSAGSYSWTQVACGGYSMFGISSNNGQLLGWGGTESGQLGFNGTTTVNRSSPTLVDAGGSFTMLAAGAYLGATNTAAFYVKTVNNTPSLYGIGNNATGQLGDGTTVNKSSPVQIGTNIFTNNKLIPNESILATFNVCESSPVQVGSGNWNIIRAGDQHTIGLNSSNNLFAWGNNRYGQLGDSTTINRSSPVQVGSSTYVDATAGVNHNAVEKSDGTIYTFGSNDFGKLGDNT